MKPIITIFALLAVIPVAILGVLLIFEIKTMDEVMDVFIKVEAAILLLAVCSVAVAFLTTKKRP